MIFTEVRVSQVKSIIVPYMKVLDHRHLRLDTANSAFTKSPNFPW